MFPSAGPGGRPQLLRVLRAEPGRPGGRRGRGRLHGHGGLEGLGPGAVNSNVLIIIYVLNKIVSAFTCVRRGHSTHTDK